ncbi:20804_t:CDS:1, partial [Dentiscutata erythropus]
KFRRKELRDKYWITERNENTRSYGISAKEWIATLHSEKLLSRIYLFISS